MLVNIKNVLPFSRLIGFVMIISYKYKYIFIELPKTGSTAIANELCQYYEGEKILNKHSTYYDFIKYASADERQFFKFSCVRNPMDQVVSRYVKLKTGQQNPEKDIKRYLKKGKKINIGTTRLLKQYKYIHNEEADFEDYFLTFYRLPYFDWSLLHHRMFDYIIRFENLSEDFNLVLQKIGIHPLRELPLLNKTKEKKDFLDYYCCPEIKKRALFVFKPYFKHYGFQFPEHWGETLRLSVSRSNDFLFYIEKIVLRFYWRYIKK